MTRPRAASTGAHRLGQRQRHRLAAACGDREGLGLERDPAALDRGRSGQAPRGREGIGVDHADLERTLGRDPRRAEAERYEGLGTEASERRGRRDNATSPATAACARSRPRRSDGGPVATGPVAPLAARPRRCPSRRRRWAIGEVEGRAAPRWSVVSPNAEPRRSPGSPRRAPASGVGPPLSCSGPSCGSAVSGVPMIVPAPRAASVRTRSKLPRWRRPRVAGLRRADGRRACSEIEVGGPRRRRRSCRAASSWPRARSSVVDEVVDRRAPS